jgi:hypothetical protein
MSDASSPRARSPPARDGFKNKERTMHRKSVFFVLTARLVFAQDVTVSVDLQAECQTLVANGIHFEGYHRSGGEEVLAPQFNNMLDLLESQLLRVGVPLREWEPANDDSDPSVTDWGGFRDEGGVTRSFLRLRELDSRGYDLWVSVWDAADWNAADPSRSDARRIRDMDEFVESIAAYLTRARQVYGVTPRFVSVNEPSIAAENGWGGYQIALTVEEQADLNQTGGRRFGELGLATRWLPALHKVHPSELRYAQRSSTTPA